MNVLITGGAGFIGSNLALRLDKEGHYVRILDNLSQQIHGKNPNETSPLFKIINNKFDFILGNVLNKEDWIKALQNIDTIVHFAAETGTGQSMYDIYNYTNTNINGTGLMLDILANVPHSVNKVVVASSRSIYGEGKYKCETHGIIYPNQRSDADLSQGHFDCKCPDCGSQLALLPTTENSLIKPVSVYATTKYTQEILVHQVCASLNISSIALRYQNVYGPGQSLSNPYTGIISIFTKLLYNNKPINIFEDGLESRDFVYIDDVVEATMLSINYNTNGNFSFNVGYGEPITVLKVVEELKKNINSSSNIQISGDYRLGDIRHNYADLKHVKEIIKFYPKVNFIDGIKEFCEWAKHNVNLKEESNYIKSLNELKEKNLLKTTIHGTVSE